MKLVQYYVSIHKQLISLGEGIGIVSHDNVYDFLKVNKEVLLFYYYKQPNYIDIFSYYNVPSNSLAGTGFVIITTLEFLKAPRYWVKRSAYHIHSRNDFISLYPRLLGCHTVYKRKEAKMFTYVFHTIPKINSFQEVLSKIISDRYPSTVFNIPVV